jgi:uncharacterized membrane protein
MIKKTAAAVAAFVCLTFAQPAIAQQGLVGHWPLDEGSGTTVDDLSGQSQPGMLGGACRWSETDRGPALGFTTAGGGTGEIPSSPAWDYAPGQVGDLTIGLWLKAPKPADGFVLSHYFSGTPAAWGLFFEGGVPSFSTYFDREDWSDDRKAVKVRFPGFMPDTWHHVAVVWKRGKQGWLKAYLDGREVDAVDKVPLTTALQHATILGSRDGNDRVTNARLRGLSLFSRTLTPEEIRSLHASGPQLAESVLVSDVTTDKILYRTTEPVTVRFRIRNASAEDRSLRVQLTSEFNLADGDTVLDERLDLPAGGMKAYEQTVPAAAFRMGGGVKVAIVDGKTVRAEKTAVFQVGDKLGEVGIGTSSSGWSQTGLAGKTSEILAVPDECRRLGVNTLELFFWSPCDWSLHVPRTDRWWSGQASYAEDKATLTELIRRAHGHGIRMLMYASCNPAGPYGWEMAYRQPEWFLNGNGDLPKLEPKHVEALDKWDDPEWRKQQPGSPGWLRVPVDLRNPDALDYGIRAILDGAEAFDWDGVRFDGHYTISGFDGISAWNMRRLKETVTRERPGFELGYNYGRAPEWREGWTHEMREAMAGGGMYLQEGIRAWHKDRTKYTSWSDYATNELRIAKRVQSLGGYYYCMWETERLPTAEAFYKAVYGLIAGGHPAIFTAERVPHCSDWGRFLTRWSRFLWDRNLRTLDVADTFTVEPDSSLVWRPLAQELADSPSRRFVVLHLVNPPPEDAIAKTTFPPAAGPVTVSGRLTGGETLRRAVIVSPQTTPFARPLEVEAAGGRFRTNIAEPGLWSMVILELEGSYTPPAAAPAFTEPADAAEVAKARAATVTARIGDPNKEEEDAAANPNVKIWETDGGMSGIGALAGTDPEAANGRCQLNTYENVKLGGGKPFIGHTWLGPLTPGKYRVTYRVKWTSGGDDWGVLFYITDTAIDRDVVRVQYASPSRLTGASNPAIKRLQPPGSFHDYSFEFVKTEPGHIHANAIANTKQAGDQKIMLDHVRTELLERISDRELAKTASGGAIASSAVPRQPEGRRPGKTLLIKGLMADRYGIPPKSVASVAYQLPDDLTKLCEFDSVVLANVDLTYSTLGQRAALKEFVNAGGRLVVLGGIATLGNGAMAGTFLEDMLPVQLVTVREVRECSPPAILADAAGKPLTGQPAVFWRHMVQPKAGATPLAKAGDTPIAVADAFGKGRVVVFTGTVLGPGGSDATPFWTTPSWQTLLGRLLAE